LSAAAVSPWCSTVVSPKLVHSFEQPPGGVSENKKNGGYIYSERDMDKWKKARLLQT